MNISYKKYDDSWSAPQTYLQGYSNNTDLKNTNLDLIKQITNTIAVYDHSTTPESLFIALYVDYTAGNTETGLEDKYTFLKTARLDKNFNVTPMFPSNGRVPNTPSKPNIITPKNNDAETQAHVLKIGRLFAHHDFNLDRFQFWLPSFIQKLDKVVSSSPSENANVWNFNGWQTNIKDLEKDTDVEFDPKTSTLKITSKISNDLIPPATTTELLLKNNDTSYIRVTFVSPPLYSIADKFITLLEGSKIEALGENFLNEDNVNTEYSFEFAFSDSLKNLLTDSPELYNRFTPGPIPSGESKSIAGKSTATTAIKDLIKFQDLPLKPTLNKYKQDGDSDLLGFLSFAVNTSSKPISIEHIILRPKHSEDPTPKEFENMVVLGTSAPSASVLAGDTYTLSFKIDQKVMRPDWPNWPDNSGSLPFIHGVAISEASAPNQPIGWALKALSVEWGEQNPADDQISPIIWHQESPSLGNAESIDFFGTAIENSDGTEVERQKIRMNTTFARHLINLAESGLDELLTWGTQQLTEPPTFFDTHAEPMDFNGAYGLYFRELFLYLPWLIADRLNQEQQYSEAERWLGYAFDTNRKKDSTGRPDYWNVVPLDDTKAPPVPTWPTSFPNDPDFIARSFPVHFRKALYLLHLDILVNRGDAAYRQLTPDGLAEAKLWYVRVLDLLGSRPDVQTVDSWAPVKLSDLNEAKSPQLRAFEQRLIEQDQRRHAHNNRAFGQPGTVPRLSVSGDASQTLSSTTDNPHFRLPFNRELVKYWDLCDSRLFNLRHNLDITGKPLHLPLFAAPLDPRALLAAWGQGVSGDGLDRALTPDIPPYRFNVMYAHAMNAVDSVIQFGATLLSLIERKEQTQHLELQQQQAWDMAKIAVDLQTQALVVEGKTREALLASQRVIKGRVDFYAKLLVDGVSSGEQQAADWFIQSNISEIAGLVMQGIGDLVMVPPIFSGHLMAALALKVSPLLHRRRHKPWQPASATQALPSTAPPNSTAAPRNGNRPSIRQRTSTRNSTPNSPSRPSRKKPAACNCARHKPH